MKDPRNEREASRLIQDSGFGRVGNGRMVEWVAPPPHRAMDCFDDETSGMRGLAVGIVAAAIVGAGLVVAFATEIMDFVRSWPC